MLHGGPGNDTYVVDNVGDSVSDNGADPNDAIESSITWTLIDEAIENLTLTGADHIDGTGNRNDNQLRGNAGNNTLIGDDGNDTLDGAAGIDTLIGGPGDDRYILRQGDVIQGETPTGGNDAVFVYFDNYVLGDNLEYIILRSDADSSGAGFDLDISVTGNGQDNILIGNAGQNVLRGLGGEDRFVGGAGAVIPEHPRCEYSPQFLVLRVLRALRELFVYLPAAHVATKDVCFAFATAADWQYRLTA